MRAMAMMAIRAIWPTATFAARLELLTVPVWRHPLVNLLLLWFRSCSLIHLAHVATPPVGDYAVGRKYSTIPAPTDASTNPTYSIGLGATFGGWITIESSTLTMGAPPKTSGMT